MDKQPRENTEFQMHITTATDIKKSVVEPNKMQAVRLQWKMKHQTGERVIKLCKSKKSDIVRVKVKVSSFPYLPTFGPSKKWTYTMAPQEPVSTQDHAVQHI